MMSTEKLQPLNLSAWSMEQLGAANERLSHMENRFDRFSNTLTTILITLNRVITMVNPLAKQQVKLETELATIKHQQQQIFDVQSAMSADLKLVRTQANVLEKKLNDTLELEKENGKKLDLILRALKIEVGENER